MANVDILKKKHCTGCGLCRNICPVGAIEMLSNDEGFLQPSINHKCINCGLCAKKCPALSKIIHTVNPIRCYAVLGKDIFREKGGSGGVFPIISELVVRKGGVVFGAAFDKGCRNLVFRKASIKAELSELYGSKYVQCDAGPVYQEVKIELESGKLVLFSGCPCQVDALKAFLGKDYDNLLTIDIFCHGVPSPYAYNKFLDEITSNGQRKVKSISFREKKHGGWGKLIKVDYEDGATFFSEYDKPYLRSFSSGILVRESCFDCQYSRDTRVGDITLGDFWGIQTIDPELDDGKGTSIVLCNSVKGMKVFSEIQNSLKRCKEIDFDHAVEVSRHFNGAMSNSLVKPRMRECFFNHLKTDPFSTAVKYAEKGLMDVGILGWWIETPNSNYGSNLTDFALYQYLHTLGLSVAFISPPNFDRNNAGEFNKKYDYRMTVKYPYDSMNENNKYFKSYIVASDTLWYYDAMIQQGWNFLLDFAGDDKRKISYATSFGNTQKFFPEHEIPYAKYLMHRFNHISVREQEGVQVCRNIFDVDATQVMDPVFLCDMCDWKMLANNAKRKTAGKFMFSYLLDPTPEKNVQLKRLAKRLGYKLITITDRQTNVEYRESILRDCGVISKATIEEFIYHLLNAEFIVTDSFHGFCFALIFDKPFITLINRTRGASRFETLSQIADCTSRMVENLGETERMTVEELLDIDRRLIHGNIEAAVEKSKAWLSNALFSEFKTPVIRAEVRLGKEIYDAKKRISEMEDRIKVLEERVKGS